MRSRRALLVAGLGAVAATAVGAIGRPLAAKAADGDPILVGDTVFGTGSTRIVSSSNNGGTFEADCTTDGYGLLGASAGGLGVLGVNQDGAIDGIGVKGRSGSVPVNVADPIKTGVYGVATQDDTALGVFGRSTVGVGVKGQSNSGIGVIGVSTSSDGVYAASDSGVGVLALSNSNSGLYCQSDTGYALEAVGRLKLSTAGIAAIPAGSTSKTITSYLLTAGSFLLLTPGVDIGTRRLWFTKNVAAHTITIHLSSSRTTATKISWLLLG
jgi:hypothetical protein